MSELEQHHQLLRSLVEGMGFPAPAPDAATVRSIETHISTVILAGDSAYKFKKPLNLGFLDFSTLEARRQYCETELAINRRLAPQIYLAVVTLNGDPAHPVINGAGPVLDYAVHMRRFDRKRQLDRLLDEGRLPTAAMDALGHYIAAFHEQTERTDETAAFGTAAAATQPMLDNFPALAEHVQGAADRARLERLEQWTHKEIHRLQPHLEKRHDQGFVRHGHGDLHLGNLVYVDDPDSGESVPVAFDAIEFDPALRWIDVISEIAFTTMDLLARQARAHAWRLLNAYLDAREDFDGLELLPLYQVYRALIRAKVAGIHGSETGLPSDEQAAHRAEMGRYLALAERLAEPRTPRLILMHGVSGSGKTVISTQVLEALGAIRLRSDIERKRLSGAVSYSDSARAEIYAHLQRRADTLLALGLTVVVDATFLTRAQREPFRKLAAARGAGFAVVACHAREDILRQRLEARTQAGNDASDAGVEVMRQQQPQQEWPTAEEGCIEVAPEAPLDPDALARQLLTPATA
ncbi:bifunctional aminoglycoside phosphotransferase/ATP-binding protein [Thioalkalivibrio sp. ALJ16]|uniref:bifunctional aminoglycoside phosphotransferase/ATP-binding protein n=1 Tax=Thioalkalivibrio sp. ALJ16 TaxID=1158762 RepID=UPI0003708919|nr:bifunctional aminoglycoside phosphotransferase/ATP-binding protein [Thioalkalivibrio sp. ALJ16]